MGLADPWVFPLSSQRIPETIFRGNLVQLASCMFDLEAEWTFTPRDFGRKLWFRKRRVGLAAHASVPIKGD